MEKLTGRTKRCSMIYASLLLCLSFHTFLFLLCSYLWILCALLGLQNLTLGTKRCSMICASLLLFLSFHTFLFLLSSYLWILYALLGLQNLTLGTPRFTHFYASLRSFKSGSLGIPGLMHNSIDITFYVLAGNGLWI